MISLLSTRASTPIGDIDALAEREKVGPNLMAPTCGQLNSRQRQASPLQCHVAVKLTTPLGEIGLIDVLHPGDTFGEQSLVDGVGVRTATVAAIERAEKLALDVRSFGELRHVNAGVDQFLLTVIGVRLQATSHQLLEALYLPAETRVLRCVERLRIMFSAGTDTSIPLTQCDVAEMAGVTRSTANRRLRHAQEIGLIRIGRAQIDVCDVAALRRKAGLVS